MKNIRGQTTLEYILVLGTVMVVVLIGLKVYLPQTQNASALYFNRVEVGIFGPAPKCGNGGTDPGETAENCCVDFRTCLP